MVFESDIFRKDDFEPIKPFDEGEKEWTWEQKWKEEKFQDNKKEIINKVQDINQFVSIFDEEYINKVYDDILEELKTAWFLEERDDEIILDCITFSVYQHLIKEKDYIDVRYNEETSKDNEEALRDNEIKTWILDTNIITNQETAVTNQETAVTNQEKILIQTNVTDANQEQTQTNQEQRNINSQELIDFTEKVEAIKPIYEALDVSLKWVPEESDILKEFFEKYGLELSDSEKNGYALRYSQYLVSFNKIQEKINSWLELNEKEKEFVAMFTELNKNLGKEIAIAIPITLKSMKAETYETKTVRRSTSLKDATDSDAILDNKNIQKHIDNKAKEPKNLNLNIGLSELSDLPRYAIKKFKAKYSEYSDIVLDDWTINKEKEKNVDKATLDKIIKEYVAQYEEEKKKNILRKIHERAILGCFRGLMRYFDINSINQENFFEDIKFNIDDDITVNKDELNKDELYVRWSIKWKNIWIYYNMDNWTVEMDDFLAEDGEWNLFVWANHWKREKLAFTLPTYDDLVKEWWKIDFSDILKKNDTEKDIDEQIQKTLDKTMDSSFKNENINKFIVWKHMEEYVAEQEILDHIFQNRLTWANYDPNLDFRQRDIKIEKSNNPNQHKLLSIINNTIEAQKTPNGLQRFRQAINKLDYFIERAKHQEKIKI